MLTQRDLQILHAIVDIYVREGEAVSSHRVKHATGLPISTATIRNVMARLEDLSTDEQQGMRSWHRRVSTFFPATTRPQAPSSRDEEEWARYLVECHYIAHPAFKVEIDPVSGIEKHHRYSCVGFVTQCYENTAVSQVLAEHVHDGFPCVDDESAAFDGAKRSLRNMSAQNSLLMDYAIGAVARACLSTHAEGSSMHTHMRTANAMSHLSFTDADNFDATSCMTTSRPPVSRAVSACSEYDTDRPNNWSAIDGWISLWVWAGA